MNRIETNPVLALEDAHRDERGSELARELYYDFLTHPEDTDIAELLLELYYE